MKNEILYQIIESALAGIIAGVMVAVFLNENGVV